MDVKDFTKKEFETWKSLNPEFKDIDYEGFKKFLLEKKEKGELFQDDTEYHKKQFLIGALLASIGLGFFFPLLWIGTIIIFFIMVLRK